MLEFKAGELVRNTMIRVTCAPLVPIASTTGLDRGSRRPDGAVSRNGDLTVEWTLQVA